MSYIANRDFLIEVQKGNVSGHSIVHKFGAAGITTNEVDVWSVASTYPFSATAPALVEAVSTSSNDAPGSPGARVITIAGLDSSWAAATANFTMNGATAVAGAASWARVNRMWVVDSGTYGNTGRDSNVGSISLQISGGGRVLAEIDQDATRGYGQTQMAVYTVPSGKTGYVLSASVNVDSNKSATFYFWQRNDADDNVTTPFRGKRLIIQLDGVATGFNFAPMSPLGPFAEKTDLWWSAIGGGAGTNVSVDFEILLVDN
ncbi:MAG: hypothetical protein ACYTEU_06145 [Planctomycetota bacterium]|jgi:hypothetical protein